MKLMLEVISPNCTELNVPTTQFEINGGSIGRSPNNDWVLPDPKRYLSSHHAVINFKDDAFYIIDKSANGTYLNQIKTPLAKGQPTKLNQNDKLIMGSYRVRVSIITSDTHSTPSLSNESSPANEDLDPLNLLGLPPKEEPPAHVQQLLAGTPVAADNSPGFQSHFAAPHSKAEAKPNTFNIPENWHDTGVSQAIDQLALKSYASEESTPAPSSAHKLKPTNSCENQANSQLFDTLLAELLTLCQATEDLRQELVSNNTSNAILNLTPLSHCQHLSDCKEKIFHHELSLEQQSAMIKDSFNAIRFHQIALLKGVIESLSTLINKLEPRRFSETFAANSSRKKSLLTRGQDKTWDAYQEHFAQILGENEESYQQAFLELFSNAYQSHLKDLLPNESI